jgi:hypothetical protein
MKKIFYSALFVLLLAALAGLGMVTARSPWVPATAGPLRSDASGISAARGA